MIMMLKGVFWDFLQSPHCAADYLQHIYSSDQGTAMCKSWATHRAPITYNISCTTWCYHSIFQSVQDMNWLDRLSGSEMPMHGRPVWHKLTKYAVKVLPLDCFPLLDLVFDIYLWILLNFVSEGDGDEAWIHKIVHKPQKAHSHKSETHLSCRYGQAWSLAVETSVSLS